MYFKRPVFIAFIVLAVVVILSLTMGQGVYEGFLYSSNTQAGCDNICRGQSYPEYCNSSYLKGGPASPCSCKWDKSSLQCLNTASNPTQPGNPNTATDSPSITGLYWY